jgi:hypothetical protein
MTFMPDEGMMSAMIIPIAVPIMGPCVMVIVGEGRSGGGPTKE